MEGMKKLFEMILKDDGTNKGIGAVSIVKDPAMEGDFIKLNKDEVKIELSTNEEQRVVTGAIMIPDKKIPRSSSFALGECDIFFSADTIKNASRGFLSGDNIHNASLEHLVKTNDVELIESWIVLNKDLDKSTALGLDVPNGTWMGSYHIKDDELWQSIKDGNFNGFSIEANFSGVEVLASKEEDINSDVELIDTLIDLEDSELDDLALFIENHYM